MGINGAKIYSFMKKLFETKYTAVIVNGQNFFDEKYKQEREKEL